MGQSYSGYVQYCGVSAKNSKHFLNRVYKSKPDYPVKNEYVRVLIPPGVSRQDVVKHLDLIRDWIVMDESVQEIHPETFFCEMEKIPKLKVYRNGRELVERTARARYPRGKNRLI